MLADYADGYIGASGAEGVVHRRDSASQDLGVRLFCTGVGGLVGAGKRTFKLKRKSVGSIGRLDCLSHDLGLSSEPLRIVMLNPHPAKRNLQINSLNPF